MEFLSSLLTNTLLQVGTSFLHNWPFLTISVLISVALKLYVDTNKVAELLMRYRRVGVIGATIAAVATPFCSCGTTAVVLGMMASMIPWAPIIAFMVASPLTSPEELIYSAGLFGWPFALAFFISSIILGLLGGLAGEILERRGWLVNQNRFASSQQDKRRASKISEAAVAAPLSARQSSLAQTLALPINSSRLTPAGLTGSAGTLSLSLCCAEAPGPAEAEKVLAVGSSTCGCGSTPATVTNSACGCGSAANTAPATQAKVPAASCGCGSTPAQAPTTQASTCGCSGGAAESAAHTEIPSLPARVSWRTFLAEFFTTGLRLLVMFLGFAFIGYLLNGLIPSAWVAALFGKGSVYSVPLAATLGLPFYINTEGSLPLVRALIDGGMSQGAALAFLITGAGSSIGAVAGALTIARWRVIAVVIGTLWAGAVLLGYLYNALLLSGLL